MSGTTASEASQSALQWMAHLPGEWIIVFDNADGAPEVVEKFIPPGLRGNVLITSRNRSLGRLTQFENSLEIDGIGKKDAISLFLKASGHVDQANPFTLEMAGKIVTKLCCLPLAVAQAGASIEAGLCNIDDYLDLYSAKRKELLSHSLFKGASEYQQTVYGTWELSFKEIESRASRNADSEDVQRAQIAIFILKFFAFMHYESIDENIFMHGAEEPNRLNVNNKRSWLSQILASAAGGRLLCCDKNSRWDKFHFQMGIQMLQSFSLVKKSLCGNSYSVHPLIHSWSRDRLSYSEQNINFCRATALLSCSITFSFGTQDYIIRQRLVPHIKASFQYAAEIGINKYYNENICSKFGLAFKENGDWTEAEKLFHQVVMKKKEIVGWKHPDTLTAIHNLASIYGDQGRWNEAEQLHIQVLDIRKRVLGQEHPHTLTTIGYLALIYGNQGRWNEAEQLHIQVLNTSKRVLGQEYPHTLTTMNNLASIYGNQGRWNEAEQLHIQVLNISKRVLGQEHPHTLTAICHLGLIYGNQGRWNEAEQLHIQVLDISKRVLRQEHPNTLTTIGHLASIYGSQGRWNEAEQLHIRVLDIRKRVLGQEHPNTLTAMNNLASIYGNQGRWNEAEQLHIQVLDIRKRVLGQEHPHTLTTMNNLALTYGNQGRWNGAEQLHIQVRDIRKKVLGQEHPNTLTTINNLASIYGNQRRWNEAEQLHIQVLDIRKRVLGQEHPETLTTMNNLASIYGNQGRWNEAEQLHIQVLNISKRVLGQEHPNTLTTMNNLALIYGNQGRWNGAEQLHVQVLDIRKSAWTGAPTYFDNYEQSSINI